MPDKSQYDTAEGYYNDVFHEIGHSTCKELERIPITHEEKRLFSPRDELVAETTAIKLCNLTKINANKTKNLAYIKFNLAKFSDDKAIQKMELERALIESDKVVALTKGKNLDAKKQHGVSNEIFNQTLQTASKKLEQKSTSNQKTRHQGMEVGIER